MNERKGARHEPRRSPWQVHVGELRRRVGDRRVAAFDAALAEGSVGSCRLDAGTVQVRLELESVSGGISVRGGICGQWVGECRRCLDPIGGTLDVDVDEMFEDVATEGETYPIDGDTIDLEPMARELLLLALPLGPVCREDCPGPDPEHFPVSVEGEAPRRDARWSVLDALREN